jgi:hypothetical protein
VTTGDHDELPLPPPPPIPKVSWYWVPRPTGVSGLEEWCKWLNFLDGILTTRALTTGRASEFNVFMRAAWEASPLLYGTLKFWLFWFGLKCLERSSHHTLRMRLIRGIFFVFLCVFLWHLCVLQFSG